MQLQANKRIVLLVDDHETILRTVSLVLESAFDLVLTAATPERAEEHLEEYLVTHVVCDYYLGQSKPRGTTLIADWRGRYPEIEKAIILTGAGRSTIPPVPIGVDGVMDKKEGPDALLAKLGV